MKVLVAFSSGKDSQASLILAVKKWGAKNVIAVYCDTQWEHPFTYVHLKEVCEQLEVELVILKSQYSFMDLAKKKNRFPSTKAKFCSVILKVEPMVDYVLSMLDKHDHLIVVQGIRRLESTSRSTAEEHCQYFKYYFQPYGYDKNNKPKYFTYRKKDVIAKNALSRVDVERPVVHLTANEVIDIILHNGQKPNPLYYLGAGRVGCYPCIQVTMAELYNILINTPEYEAKIIEAENEVGRQFFHPSYIPKRYHDFKDENGKSWASAKRVFEYIKDKHATGKIDFTADQSPRSCMTAFNICE